MSFASFVRNAARLILAGFTFGVAACSNYDSRWKATAAGRSSQPDARAYEGKWISHSHEGVVGKLWCILEPQPDGRTYQAEFKATWLKVFSSTHKAELKAGKTTRKGEQPFSGSATVDTWVGAGDYRCSGVLTPDRIHAKYDATYDTGVFELNRVKAKAP